VPETLPFSTRLWLSFVCFFRVLFDGRFAARVLAARAPESALPAPPPALESPTPPAPDATPALQLLGLLQREGRLVDFVQQDIASFADAEVGAAARVVHEGCRRALTSHLRVRPIMSENEGDSVTVAATTDPSTLKLIGNVGAARPARGILRHRDVLAPAEVEV
jgi:hypothetical protein